MSLTVTVEPEDQILAMRTYRQALAAGDYTLASRSAAVLVRSGSAPPDTAILALAVAVEAGDSAGVDTALARIASGPLNFAIPVLKAWLAMDRGGDPMVPLFEATGNPLTDRYVPYHLPLLMIATGRTGEAMRSLEAMLGKDPNDDDLRIDASELLARAGEAKLALPLIAGDRADYALLRKRIGKGAKPGLRYGAARLFLGIAQDIADQGIADLSIALTRASLLLDPRDDRARLYLGKALSEDGAGDLAAAELGKVAKDSPYFPGARTGLIVAYQRAGRLIDALALAKGIAQDRRADAGDARTYGDLLAADAQYAAAAAAYGAAIKRTPGDGGWELHYLRGSALDRAGRWDEALPDLRRAVALGPDQAPALAYLGAAQIKRGENFAEAQDLLEQASALKPEDAGISASLAWAYFTRGDVTRALPMLEKAVQGDPGGVAPNEHLGDAYWTLGRHYEARYAWNAATIYADVEAVRRIQGKIAQGL